MKMFNVEKNSKSIGTDDDNVKNKPKENIFEQSVTTPISTPIGKTPKATKMHVIHQRDIWCFVQVFKTLK